MDTLNKTFPARIKLEEDKHIATWTLASNPIVPMIVAPSYLAMVYLGPIIMKNRPPLSLRKLIMVYNIIQVAINGYLVHQYFTVYGTKAFTFWKYPCYPVTAASDFSLEINIRYLEALKIYYLTKILDLMDTLFFILRKKNSQITLLHVYHHTSMVISTFMSVMVFREEMFSVMGALNALVHVIMYSYYFLSAMGPQIQKYLWWKKYITTIQMMQFVISFSLLVQLAISGCDVPLRGYLIWVPNISIFMYLFFQFYCDAYVKKSK